jgi:dihydrofolate reductase
MTIPLPELGDTDSPDHTAISRRFLTQAKKELGKGDRLQASEKAWGTLAHSLKAIAQARGWRHWEHNHVLAIGYQLAREHHWPDLQLATTYANTLHQNVYENFAGTRVIQGGIDLVETLLPELDAIRLATPGPFTIQDEDDRGYLRLLTGYRSLQIGDSSPVGFSLLHSL